MMILVRAAGRAAANRQNLSDGFILNGILNLILALEPVIIFWN